MYVNNALDKPQICLLLSEFEDENDTLAGVCGFSRWQDEYGKEYNVSAF